MDSNSRSVDRTMSHPNNVYGAHHGERNQFRGYVETDGKEYNGISNITKKSTNKSDFLERFQGRQSLMNKEGHLGIVKNTQQPIKKVDKIELNPNLLRSSQKQSN